MKAYMYKALAIVAGMAISAQVIAAEAAAPSTEDGDAIALHQLWDSYQQAVAKKDAKELIGFYVNDNVPVMGGIAPKSYALVTAANKQPVPRTQWMTAKEDVAGEIKLPPDQTENLSIHSHGEIGSISFDYAAKIGHGHIIWSTVRTNEGWKIASMLYSINLPAADKKSSQG